MKALLAVYYKSSLPLIEHLLAEKLPHRQFFAAKTDDMSAMLHGLREMGFDNIMVQPLLMYRGREFEKITGQCPGMPIGSPLTENPRFCAAVESLLPEKPCVLVCHGVGDRMELDFSRKDIFVGALHGEPRIDEIIEKLPSDDIYLCPLLLTAGVHARRDIGAAWKERLESAGHQVEFIYEGLGEYREIAELFAENALKCEE